MKKILILLLLGMCRFPVIAQENTNEQQELEREIQATFQRIDTALTAANAELAAGNADAVSEVASLEAHKAFTYIMACQDYKSALPWLRSAIDRKVDWSITWLKSDIARAYTAMALFYENGWADVSKDDQQAFYWYQKAAQGGDPQGMFRLGLFYDQGRATAKDDARAFEWWLSAARNEERDSYRNVAIYYYLGIGVKRDFTQAAVWAQKGSETGDGYCTLTLGIIYANGQGVKRDYNKALALFSLAAEQGETGAYQAVAECYYYGRGVKRDRVAAKSWCQRGVDVGDEDALTFMKRIER